MSILEPLRKLNSKIEHRYRTGL
jgi:spore coat protein A